MSHYEETFSIDIGDDVDTPVKTLCEFYLHNGYEADSGDGPQPVLRRGESGAGWLSSKMTDLATTVTIEEGDDIELKYHVDTTGQHLTDEDRAFWTTEAQAAESYLRGDRGLTDMRPLEKKRVKELRGELRSVGLWAMAIVFVTVFVVGIIGDRLGCI